MNELRLEQILFDLLKLKTDKPDEICLTVHGENHAALNRLVRALLQCVEDANGEIAEIYCLTTIAQKDAPPLERPVYGRSVWSVAVKEPENFFAKTQKEVVCAQFKITGERARLLFAAESGVHYFVADNQIIDDSILDKKFEFDGRIIAPTVFQAIEENLLKTALDLIE